MQFVDRVIAKPVSAEALLEQLAELTRSRVVPPRDRAAASPSLRAPPPRSCSFARAQRAGRGRT